MECVIDSQHCTIQQRRCGDAFYSHSSNWWSPRTAKTRSKFWLVTCRCNLLRGLTTPRSTTSTQPIPSIQADLMDARHGHTASGSLTAMSPDCVMYLTQGREGYWSWAVWSAHGF